ncbi:hypothetical protein ARALYDRAFT_900350 [Arabidopsis lyrata subsp. lyrata]|uniref:Uncharacterized protein n=1 Tax=Arabidopsis lyrata subsp. lyrata TaxID=81972 RepID=D7L2S5_ARALL|nr:hypothetical protein ARALYDRAFT_900350 [Arabidopsis lyrata subsp. lyrata]
MPKASRFKSKDGGCEKEEYVVPGKSLQLGHITQFTKTVHSAASGYNITLKAKDPQESSYQTFKAQVNEKKYARLVLVCTSSGPPEEGVANLKILKVAMEITPHLEEEEPFYKGLGAYDAIFYIRYKDPCKARAGDDVDSVAIVRRVVDVHLETFILVGRTHLLPQQNHPYAV